MVRGSIGEVLGKIFNGKNIATVLIVGVALLIFANYLFKEKYGPGMNIGLGVFAVSIFGIIALAVIIMVMGIMKGNFEFRLTEFGAIIVIGVIFVLGMILSYKYLGVDLGVFSRSTQQIMSIVGIGG